MNGQELENDLKLVKDLQKEVILLSQASSLLGWDLRTNMPKKGAKTRAEQLALLDKLSHEKYTSDELWNSLNRLKDNLDNLSYDDQIMVKKLYRDIELDRKLPKEFVEEFSRAAGLSAVAWEEARDKKDFNIFKPHLEKVIELVRKKASLIGLPGHPYNSLLDRFEEGMTVEMLKPAFEKIKLEIVKLLHEIKNSEEYKKQEKILLRKDFPKEKQMELASDFVNRIGLHEDFSRLDFSEHPFTTSIARSNDVRITTNVRENPMFAFGSTIHESGHGLYNSNLPEEYGFNILGDSLDSGMHESQSRLWEVIIGKSKPFWKFYFPKFSKVFDLGDNLEQWYREVNSVEPSMIRIESDELHYPLHIILRFEIELGLIEGTIKVEDLPRIWNEKMQEYMGIKPRDDKEGVLQDVHWSEGYVGYFPTYTLGNIYAAQLYEAMKKEMPGIEDDIESGAFSRIRVWLKEKIHKHGRKYLTEDLIKEICGEGLNPDKYIEYLRKKYGEIYNLNSG